jgi:hypothetical protein
MLYKFKSKATGDLIMLEPNGRSVLQAIGKDPGPKGIIQPPEMAGAIAALEAAVARDEAERQAAADEAKAQGEAAPQGEGISLRQRALPFIEMLRRAQKADESVVWGV